MTKAETFLIGVAIFFLGLMFNFAETWYYGWNLKPQSPGEMVCDYIAYAAVMAGLFMTMYAVFIKKTTEMTISLKWAKWLSTIFNH